MAALERVRSWAAIAALLLAWNSFLAYHAGPLTLLHFYDDVQYQRLAQNRLAGHYEIGDSAQTVGMEGSHPMWRPGLVWVSEAFAQVLGGVRQGAAAASAVGTTLLEVVLLFAAWRIFGGGAFVAAVVLLLTPFAAAGPFVRLAVGQGPEPWAAACVLSGLVALCEGRRRVLAPSATWPWFLAAAALAACGEWFRTGNWLLFAVPCVSFAAAGLWQRNRRLFAGALLSVVSYFAINFVVGLLTPSPLAKTVVNLRHNLCESRGPSAEFSREGRLYVVPLGGMQIVPGTAEIVADHIVRTSHSESTSGFLEENFAAVLDLYLDRLERQGTGGLVGLREMAGPLVVLGCIAALCGLCSRRGDRHLEVLALMAAALAQVLGPITLLVGDSVSVYLLVPLPMFVVVAAHGLAAGVVSLARRISADAVRKGLAGAAASVLLGAAVLFHIDVVATLRHLKQQADQEQAALDALNLRGRIACRAMGWLVDRPIEPVYLPYASVDEIARYLRARRATGILLRTNEAETSAWANPYGTLDDLERALRQSACFEERRVSGNWRWYGVR